MQKTVSYSVGEALRRWAEVHGAALLVYDGDGSIIAATEMAEQMLSGGADLEGRAVDEVVSISHADRVPSRNSGYVEVSVQPVGSIAHGPKSARLLPCEGLTLLSFTHGCMSHSQSELLECAAAEELLSQISHEIRNPLAGISTSLEMLATRLDDDGRGRLLRIRSEIERVTTLLKNLSDLYRPPSPQRSHCSFGKVIRQCLNLFEPLSLARGVTVDLDLSEIDTLVPIDSTRLTSILQNLILNGLQAMKCGGVLELRCSRSPDGGLIARIRDTGPGIDPERMEYVFKPFWSSRPGGTGLGLPVARRFMDECRGQIEIESVCGQGTTVVLSFPGVSDRSEERVET